MITIAPKHFENLSSKNTDSISVRFNYLTKTLSFRQSVKVSENTRRSSISQRVVKIRSFLSKIIKLQYRFYAKPSKAANIKRSHLRKSEPRSSDAKHNNMMLYQYPFAFLPILLFFFIHRPYFMVDEIREEALRVRDARRYKSTPYYNIYRFKMS